MLRIASYELPAGISENKSESCEMESASSELLI